MESLAVREEMACKRTSWHLAFSAFSSENPYWASVISLVSSSYSSTCLDTCSEAAFFWMMCILLMAQYPQPGRASVWKPHECLLSPLRRRKRWLLDRFWGGFFWVSFFFFGYLQPHCSFKTNSQSNIRVHCPVLFVGFVTTIDGKSSIGGDAIGDLLYFEIWVRGEQEQCLEKGTLPRVLVIVSDLRRG